MKSTPLSAQNSSARFSFGSICLLYRREKSGTVSFSLIPASRVDRVVEKRENLETPEILRLPAHFQPVPARGPDPLVQLHVRGGDLDLSPPPRFAQGRTLRNGEASLALKLKTQVARLADDGGEVVTELEAAQGFGATHRVAWRAGEDFVRVTTVFHNRSAQALTLDMLSSFSLAGITPFEPANAPGCLVVHRLRSCWSAEARHEAMGVEALHLENSWAAYGACSERFGQVGSMPVRGFFPLAAVEDRKNGVVWGAQLGIASSWQMEFYRSGDDLALSGGLADREFGHWWKTVAPGDSFAAPEAVLAVVCGDFQDLCHALTSAQNAAAEPQPESEKALPALFNEWCSSWGNPTHENLLAVARRLKGRGLTYLLMDDGWAERPGEAWQQNGDWIVNRRAFPEGLKATCDALRAEGFIPGIWFEFEVCNPGSKAWDLTDHQLHRDGRVLRVGPRRFWDFRDPWTRDYLTEKVIRLLRESGFGYVKVDYNETVGIGVDGDPADGPGEHLRQHIEGVREFFREMRRQLPEVAVEICSSGGHRLEPSMMALCSMGAFSDSHETVEIPLIAANLHQTILPRQCQVWAVLRQEDSRTRTEYSLAATFLGRPAISGDLVHLPDWMLERLAEAMAFHRRAVPILARGKSRRFGRTGASWRHPEGWQAVRRMSADGARGMCVFHAFANPPSAPVTIPLPEGDWKIETSFGALDARLESGTLVIPPPAAFSGGAVLLALSP